MLDLHALIKKLSDEDHRALSTRAAALVDYHEKQLAQRIEKNITWHTWTSQHSESEDCDLTMLRRLYDFIKAEYVDKQATQMNIELVTNTPGLPGRGKSYLKFAITRKV